ncbi:MAG: hypothetical protein R2754_08220 [Microthrixaceae bacterium]
MSVMLIGCGGASLEERRRKLETLEKQVLDSDLYTGVSVTRTEREIVCEQPFRWNDNAFEVSYESESVEPADAASRLSEFEVFLEQQALSWGADIYLDPILPESLDSGRLMSARIDGYGVSSSYAPDSVGRSLDLTLVTPCG